MARKAAEQKRKELTEKRLKEMESVKKANEQRKKELLEQTLKTKEQKEKVIKEKEQKEKELLEKTIREKEYLEKVRKEKEQLKKEQIEKQLKEKAEKEILLPPKIKPKVPQVLISTKVKKYRPFIIVFTFFILITVILGILIFKDRRKSFGFVPEEEINYALLSWEEKADDQGYSRFAGLNAEFLWKADIYVPDTSFIFKVQDISRLVFHIKNLD